MRQVGRLSRPRHPIWAEAWPTGNPTVREAASHLAPGHDEDGVARVLAKVFGL